MVADFFLGNVARVAPSHPRLTHSVNLSLLQAEVRMHLSHLVYAPRPPLLVRTCHYPFLLQDTGGHNQLAPLIKFAPVEVHPFVFPGRLIIASSPTRRSTV